MRLCELHRAARGLMEARALPVVLERVAKVAAAQMRAERVDVELLNDTGELQGDYHLGEGEMKTDAGTLEVSIPQGRHSIGTIKLARLDGNAFNSDDVRVARVLAEDAAVAITNVRLIAELTSHEKTLSRRNENLGLLNQLAATLASSTEIDQILDQALSQVMAYLRLEVGEVYLRQEDSTLLRLVLHHGELVRRMWNHEQYHTGQGIIGQVARSIKARIIELPGRLERDLNKDLIEKCFKQIGVFPLAGRKGSLGVMSVGSCQPRPLDELEIQFLTAISAWVGAVIENVRLNLQGKRLAILEERERIGMDLHDGIIQSIYAVGLTLENARLLLEEDSEQARQRIDQSINGLNSAIRDIRAYILDLRPRHLRNESLMEGIQRLVAEFRANTLVEVNLKGPQDASLSRLPEANATVLFHICQEALANIAKHAHARHVDVVVWTTRDRVLLEVQDDGRGFESSSIRTTIGHGLSNMQIRAHNAGGEVDITSEIEAGTTVLAWVPRSSKKQHYVAE
jgi:two-component system sensor histidine kinase DevS